MNVYEEAHNLARAIKESNEFKEFDRLKKEVDQDPQLSAEGFADETNSAADEADGRRKTGFGTDGTDSVHGHHAYGKASGSTVSAGGSEILHHDEGCE